MTYIGDYNTSSTVRIYFTTHAQTGAAVAPSTAFEAADVKLYKNGSATERTSQSGWTMTSPFDSITGLHLLAIDLSDNTDAGFYAAAGEYAAVLSPDETVDGLAVVKVLATFSIERLTKVNATYHGGTLQTGGDVIGQLTDGTAGLSAAQVERAAIKTQTDKFVFTVANEVNANTRYVGGTGIQQSGGYVKSVDASTTLATVVRHDGTDSTSGATLEAAIEAAAAGTTVYVGPGTFAIGDNQIIMPAGVSVKGAGRDITRITSSRVTTTTQLLPGNRCMVESLTWESLNVTDGIGDYPIGCISAEAPFTNAIFRDIRVIGRTDCFILSVNNCSFTLENFILESKFDALASTAGTANACYARNGIIDVQENTVAAIGRGIFWSGKIIAHDVQVKMQARASLATVDMTGILISASARGHFYNCGVYLNGTALTTNVSVAGTASATATANMINCEYDRSKTTGTVNDQLSPLQPTTVGTKLDITATGGAGVDWANVENPTTTLNLSGTTVKDATDVETKLGTPAGASVSADIANISAGSSPTLLQTTTIATLASQTSFTLTAGSADNDAYNGGFAVFTDAVTSTQKAFNIVSDYTGSTKTVTLLNAPAFTIATGDTVSIVANPNSAILSATNVDIDHTWKFSSPSQVTAPNTLSELIGFIGLLAMDFTEPMPARSSIASISSASFANISGTEPTVTSSSVSLDNKRANVLIDATAATANTYTLSVTIVTTDSQTIVRKGRLTVA